MKRIVFVGIILLYLCPSAHAVSYSYTFSGTLTDVNLWNQPQLSFITVGSSFTGTLLIEYENPVPDYISGSKASYWRPEVTVYHSATIAESFFSYDIGSAFNTVLTNDGNSDSLWIDSMETVAQCGGYHYGGDSYFYFVDDTSTAFDSVLIEDMPVLNESLFTSMRFRLNKLDGNNGGVDFIGEIDTIRRVPEPASIMLLGLGIAGFITARRKFSKK